MSSPDPILLANAKAKGKRPYFLDDPAVERVLSITMAVAGELAVMRERMDTIERLLEQNTSISRDDIENFIPDDAAAAERGQWHKEFIARILRIVQQEIEGLKAADTEKSCEELAEEFGREDKVSDAA
ncbi:MAG: hypothetical protein D6763_00170 [Alphaproteobacteria bacterium]|nr:MAG: hypothetical protein D6763_00170 [Alphaproteobacteria bacterium]